MPFWELASSLNSERSQVIFQVGYYCSCGSRIMKLNRIIGLNIWLEGWYREKSMKGSTKTTERWVFLQSVQKKSIEEVCKLKKRGRGTIGKKSKQRRGKEGKCPLNLKVQRKRKQLIVFADIPRMAVVKQQSEQQYQKVHTVRAIWVSHEIYMGTLLCVF